MKNPALASIVFGIYALAMGIGFTVAPNMLLSIFSIPATMEVWIRVVGLLASVIGIYYLYAGRSNDLHFFRMSVIGRTLFFVGMTAFALLNLGPTILIAFGLVDLLAAAWTAYALRANGELKF
ncbi:MAG: hypothetical protein JNJ61_18120 [Anaerolineae bacterium]|nr:hypothetical protein [Anaerolineae bacterium]